MNTTEQQIIIKERPKNTSKVVATALNNPPSFNYLDKIIKNGVLGGVLMGAYLLVLQLSNTDHTIWLKFVKYLFLAAVLGVALVKAKDYFPPVTYFKRGIQVGAGIAVFSGLTLMAINFALYFLNPELAFNKFNLEAKNIGEIIILDVVILFETFVYGMILTFICLQFLKYPRKGA